MNSMLMKSIEEYSLKNEFRTREFGRDPSDIIKELKEKEYGKLTNLLEIDNTIINRQKENLEIDNTIKLIDLYCDFTTYNIKFKIKFPKKFYNTFDISLFEFELSHNGTFLITKISFNDKKLTREEEVMKSRKIENIYSNKIQYFLSNVKKEIKSINYKNNTKSK